MPAVADEIEAGIADYATREVQETKSDTVSENTKLRHKRERNR